MPLDDFASLTLRLSEAGESRDEVLAAAGLTEQTWEAHEAHWAAALDAAEAAHGDADGVPPLLATYAEAFTRAQAKLHTRAPLTFERYAELTRALQSGEAIAETLERAGLPLSAYLESHRHWTQTMTTDGELALRFAQLLARDVTEAR